MSTVDVADTDAVLRRGHRRRRPGLARVADQPDCSRSRTCPRSRPRRASAGALVVVDNTFATPLLQRPLEHGADVVVHSATKCLAGHSDVLLGVAGDAPTTTLCHGAPRTAGRRIGAIPGPLEAWLALRGLRTLHLRVERAQSNATELADGWPSIRRSSGFATPGFGAMIASS